MHKRNIPQNRVDMRYSTEVNQKVQSLLKRYRHDVLWLEYPYQSKILEKSSDSLIKVIDTHDKFAYRNYKAFPFVHKVVDYSLTFGGERKALSRADYVIAIQKEEKNIIKDFKKGKRQMLLR